ncbi:ribosomal RNA small subunit methyltransferase A [Abditibacteriota bacterium]|nr:ribosomal RNA small subunit methyltransferase A [Abditibacteriota bacterium]
MISLSFDPADYAVARSTLGSLGAAPNKSLGQNFLLDKEALNAICDAAQLQATDSVLEIGPGLGALTVRLLARAERVTSIEKDTKFAAFLTKKLKGDGFKLVEGDALEVGWDKLGLPEANAKIVANLPYSISKPVLRRIIEEWRPHLTSATVLVQREVAFRLTAPADTEHYGPMSVMSQLYTRPHMVFDIAPEAFLPPPKVTSTVVHFEMLRAPSIELASETRFWATVRAAFGQRRKNLGNTLKPLASREKLAQVFEQTGVDPKRRGETLSIQEFELLARAIWSD